MDTCIQLRPEDIKEVADLKDRQRQEKHEMNTRHDKEWGILGDHIRRQYPGTQGKIIQINAMVIWTREP